MKAHCADVRPMPGAHEERNKGLGPFGGWLLLRGPAGPSTEGTITHDVIQFQDGLLLTPEKSLGPC